MIEPKARRDAHEMNQSSHANEYWNASQNGYSSVECIS